MTRTILYAPNRLKYDNGNRPIVFLAGSIEMGAAELWQDKLINKVEYQDVLFLNPRRADWDSSWEQTKDNPQFREQVVWELDGQNDSDLIVLYFDPATKSPISLLELGLFYHKMVVCCPEGFWRKGNVDIVCEYFGVPQVGSLEALAEAIDNYLTR